MIKKQKYRIGIVADLSPNGSIHQQTFIRAVQAAAEDLNFTGKNIELFWENDFAHEAGGNSSSKILLKRGVHCVVGHFASAAARGALPQYENRGIPLLLPASTADALTENFQSALRICPKDSDLSHFIIGELRNKNISEIFVEHDGSVHGRSLAGDLVSRMQRSKHFQLLTDINMAENIIFVGSYTKSIAFAKSREPRKGKLKRIFFTDDAVHNSLVEELLASPYKIGVFGFDDNSLKPEAAICVRNYEIKWKAAPNTYYLETYAAMQVVDQLIQKANLLATNNLLEQVYIHRWKTVLGSFRFTPQGENRMKHFAFWVPAKNGLKKEALTMRKKNLYHKLITT